MNLNLDFKECYVNDSGVNLVCYERTDKFAFMCPYEENVDGSLKLDISKTYVYSTEIDEDIVLPISAIDNFIVEKAD